MAEVHFALGADIDVTSSTELSDAVSGLKSHMDGKFRPSPLPIYRSLGAAGTFPASVGAANSLLQVSLGSPSAGRIWRVTRVLVLGADDHTTAAGIVGSIYVGDPANPFMMQAITEGRVLPFTQANNDEFVWVHSSEALFVNFSATAAVASAQTVAVTATAIEYVACASEAQTI